MNQSEIHMIATECAPGLYDFDKCIPTVDRIIARMEERGIDTRLMRLKGARHALPKADRRWREMKQSAWIHYVAWLPEQNIAIDATGAQFGLTQVRILSRDQIEAEWEDAVLIE